jgi:Arc/MetJ-type ribon-helix-helix transcriptional regulator
MPRKSSRANYTGLSMPKELMDEVEKVIEKNPELQYRSRAEFVKAAIREKLHRERWVKKGKIKKRDLIPAGLEKYADLMIRAAGGNPSDYYPDDEPAMEKEQSNTDVVKEISDLKKKLDAILRKLDHVDVSEK